MSGPEGFARAAAAVLAVLGGRGREPWRLVLFGLLTGVAAFGFHGGVWPEPRAAAVLGLAAAALVALVLAPVWPPLALPAFGAGALLATGLAAAAAGALRSLAPWSVLTGAAAVFATAMVFSSVATAASAEAGWRRASIWTGAVLASAAAAGGAAAAVHRWGTTPSVAGLAVLAGVCAWLPAVFLEHGRVRRELQDEVRLGFLAGEDAEILSRFVGRGKHPRLARPDERRELVRSALLLSVARQQQRRRRGEAERLRQLEVLTFRTRLRRALEARMERDALIAAAELDGALERELEDGEGGRT